MYHDPHSLNVFFTVATVFVRIVCVGLTISFMIVAASVLRWQTATTLFDWMDAQQLKLSTRGRRVINFLHLVPAQLRSQLEAHTGQRNVIH